MILARVKKTIWDNTEEIIGYILPIDGTNVIIDKRYFEDNDDIMDDIANNSVSYDKDTEEFLIGDTWLPKFMVIGEDYGTKM